MVPLSTKPVHILQGVLSAFGEQGERSHLGQAVQAVVLGDSTIWLHSSPETVTGI